MAKTRKYRRHRKKTKKSRHRLHKKTFRKRRRKNVRTRRRSGGAPPSEMYINISPSTAAANAGVKPGVYYAKVNPTKKARPLGPLRTNTMMTVHDLYTIPADVLPADVLKHSNILLKRTKYGFDNGGIPYSVISKEDAQLAQQALINLSIVLGDPDTKIAQLTKAINDAGAAGINSHRYIEYARKLRSAKWATRKAAARDEYSTPEAAAARVAEKRRREEEERRVAAAAAAAAAAAEKAAVWHYPDSEPDEDEEEMKIL
jgi:hypothetical protein